jgi:hypothetical protein
VSAPEHDRFVAMFDELSPRVFGYVRRHVDHGGVDDLVAETFLMERELDPPAPSARSLATDPELLAEEATP